MPNAEDAPLSDVQRALATVCAHYFAVFVLAAGLLKCAAVQTTGDMSLNFADQTAMVSIVTSLLLGTTARRGLISSEASQAIAPWLLVIGALAISIVELWQPWPAGSLTVGISWVCLWIVGFPNAGPRLKGSWPAFVAASMGPAALTVGIALGDREFPGFAQSALFFLPSYIAAAAVTVRVERIVTQMDDDRIGGFRLLERLGGGGMGEVWRAEHRLLGTPAAVKLILPSAHSTPSEKATLEFRFRREARATSELRSPHTVRLFDFGLDRDGRYFYIMELIDGVDMDTLVNRFGPVTPERCVHFLRQSCLSLAEAHEQGMVHRDIKPANILVSRLGVEVDQVKVVDFGLVAFGGALEESRDATITSSKITVLGTVAGTPAFISPEAIQMKEIDHRADLYALGAVAVWLLTGELLFEGSAQQCLRAHVHDEPVPPSKRTELEIPTDLEKLILDCLDKDPERRPQSALQLLRQLEQCECAGDWTDQKARTWWLRHLR